MRTGCNQRLVIGVVIWAALACCVNRGVWAQDSDDVANDECVLQLNVPEGASITVDGRAYGTKRELTFRKLKPGARYASKVIVHLPDGREERRTVFVKGGQRIQLTFEGPPTALSRMIEEPKNDARPELVLQAGHTSAPLYADFSPDGRYVVTGHGVTAILWEVATGRQLRTYAGHTETLTGLAFFPDGSRIITGSYDKTVVIWDRDTGRKLRTIQCDQILCWALSADGKQVLVGKSYAQACLFSTTNGQRLRVFDPKKSVTEAIKAVAFSPDGRRIVTGSTDKTVVLWDAATGRKLRTFGGHSYEIGAVAFHPDGRRLVVGGGDLDHSAKTALGELVLWDVIRGTELARDRLDNKFWGVTVSPDGRQVCASILGYRNAKDFREHILYSADNLERIQSFHGEKTNRACAFSPDGRLLFAGEVLRNVQTGEKVRTFSGHQDSVSDLLVVPGKDQLIVNRGERIVLTEVNTASDLRQFAPKVEGQYLGQATLTPDGEQLFAISRGGSERPSLEAFDVRSGARLCSYPVATKRVDKLSVSDDGKRALMEMGQRAELWDIPSGCVLRTFGDDEHRIGFQSTSLSPNGQIVITSPKEPFSDSLKISHCAALWDAATGRQLRTLDLPTEPNCALGEFRFTPDGRTAIGWGQIGGNYSGGGEGVMVFFDVENGRVQRTLRGHNLRIRFLTLTPDGRYAVSYSDDENTAIVWDLSTSKNLRLFRTNAGYSRPRPTPDGRRLLTPSADGSVRIHDVATGDELARLVRLADDQGWLTITPEGLFDGPAAGRRHVGFRIGGRLNVVPVDRFFQDFYRPGLLAEIWRGEQPMPTITLAGQAAPSVRIVSPTQGGTVDTPQLTLRAEVTDQGGGVKGPWLLHNDARVLAPGQPVTKGKIVERSFKVALIEGENRLKVTAASKDGSWESEPAVLTLKYTQKLTRPRIHLLAVGANRYVEEAINLRFAAPDAKAIARLFTERGKAFYGADNVHIVQLVDEQATLEGIKDALNNIADTAKPQDTLVVFLAGHGTIVGQRYYFIPHEYKTKTGKLEEDIRQQGLAGDILGDWLSAVPALKRVVIYDTCQSGGAISIARTARNPFAFRGAMERLSRAQGVFTIAATAAGDEAQEVPELGHGVLTYALLAGLGAVDVGPLKQQAISPKEGKMIDVRDWFSFAQDKVPVLTKYHFGREQFVAFSGHGQSFPVLPLE